MKKTICIIVLIILLSFSFASCSYISDFYDKITGKEDTVVGTYYFASMKYDEGGMHFEYNVGEKINGVSLDETFMTITLNEDNTFTFSSNMPGSQFERTGTWTKNDDKISFSTIEFYATVEKNKLILEEEDATKSARIVLEK